MKQIEGIRTRQQRTTNCGGPSEWFDMNRFEIEDADVGRIKPHYLGHHHKDYKFTKADVGKMIEVTSQPNGYCCWVFIGVTA